MNSQQNLTEPNSIETNYIEKIIYHLTNSIYNELGTNLLFKYTCYIKVIFENTVLYFMAENMCSKNFNYFMKIKIVEEVKMNSKIWKHRRCKYCRDKKCDAQLSCCNSNIHYKCALNNNFTCDCINCNDSSKRIILINTKQESSNISCGCEENKDIEEIENTCSICFDECETKTECGHLVCKKCMDQMYQNDGEQTKCPICRNGLYNAMVCIDNYEVKIGGRTIKVKADIYK